MKILFFIVTLTVYLSARYEAYASKECEAYNNMKHTKNSNHIILEKSKKYTVLKSHKGQKLILLKDENPTQRWVDEECFLEDETEITLTQMEEELARLEKEMAIALGKDVKAKKKPLSTKPHRTKASIPTEEERARPEQKTEHTLGSKKKKRTRSQQNILALSWHNAFCQTHRHKKECKRGLGSFIRSKSHDNQFVLHGLWPQPRKNTYCNVSKKDKALDKAKRWSSLPSLSLDRSIREKLSLLMPGYASDLHKHEWIKHGSCYGTDANSYFATSLSLLEQFNRSSLAAFFKLNSGKRVTLTQIKKIAQKEFGRGTSKSIAIQCKRGMITEIWLQLGSGSEDLSTLLKRGKKLYSRCKGGLIDRAGFGR